MNETTQAQYNACLDEIYSSFMSVKHLVKGKHDSEVRKPQIMLEIIQKLSLVPPPDRTIRITGSKGKGTTSRLIAHYLRTLKPEARVGLIVSPEELDHVDRMQINGKAISHQEFIQIYDELKPVLQQKQSTLKDTEYLSPSGTFLLMALKWFQQEGVTDFVIECGRGVLFDEVGQLSSKVSAVTSILLEHPSYLGPTLADIAKDKLSIRHTSEWTIVDATAAQWYEQLYSKTEEKQIDAISPILGDITSPKPNWFFLDQTIARVAVEKYLDHSIQDPALLEISSTHHSPSFGFCRVFEVDFYYEALISANSIDQQFWSQLIEKYDQQIVFLASLPDDKDLAAIHDQVCQLGARIQHVVLEGTRGYLSYTKTLAHYRDELAGTLAIDSPDSSKNFIDLIQGIASASSVKAIYALGTQTYIRLVKKSLQQLQGEPSTPVGK